MSCFCHFTAYRSTHCALYTLEIVLSVILQQKHPLCFVHFRNCPVCHFTAEAPTVLCTLQKLSCLSFYSRSTHYALYTSEIVLSVILQQKHPLCFVHFRNCPVCHFTAEAPTVLCTLQKLSCLSFYSL